MAGMEPFVDFIPAEIAAVKLLRPQCHVYGVEPTGAAATAALLGRCGNKWRVAGSESSSAARTSMSRASLP